MIFYFTGTGNSLYVAKQFDENPVSIPQIIDNDNIYFEDESIGVIFPIYAHIPPQMVQDFLKKAVFKTDYFFIIETYGNRHCGSAQYVADMCREWGIDVKYVHTIKMVDNWLPGFDVDEQVKIDKKVDEQIAEALKDVAERKIEIPKATDEEIEYHKNLEQANAKIMPNLLHGEMFNITDECIGCGICSKVCPEAAFEVKDGKAVRNRNYCQMCLACVHNCPQKAIKLNIPEKNPNVRYRNENISLNEIIKANCRI